MGHISVSSLLRLPWVFDKCPETCVIWLKLGLDATLPHLFFSCLPFSLCFFLCLSSFFSNSLLFSNVICCYCFEENFVVVAECSAFRFIFLSFSVFSFFETSIWLLAGSTRFFTFVFFLLVLFFSFFPFLVVFLNSFFSNSLKERKEKNEKKENKSKQPG